MKTKNFKKKLPALVVGTMLLAGGLRVPNTFAAQGLPAGPVENNIEGRVLVVAQDGSGQFTNVQDAVNAVQIHGKSRVTILIKKGVYRGMVYIPATKPDISFVGETGDPKDVVIVEGHAHGMLQPNGQIWDTDGSATVTVAGDGFQARNITFQNDFNPAQHPEIKDKQAVAIKTVADQVVYDNDRFLGQQDTLFASSYSDPVPAGSELSTIPVNPPGIPQPSLEARQYYHNDYIEGTTDFIFGSATAVFDHCTIKALSSSYVTAADTEMTRKYGFLITDSTITSDPSVAPGSVYLGRPWRHTGTINPVAQVTIRNTWLPSAINSQQWHDWSKPYFRWQDARYYEYQNYGPGAENVLPEVKQFTDSEAADFTIEKYFGDWTPRTK